jgi:hypothetical protein
MITLLSYSKRGSIKYGDLNRFGIVSARVNDMTIDSIKFAHKSVRSLVIYL